mmetsp:Transcript_2089/g.6322  ORF Transcript_2089/g.6322 Transcript_2089/m.6322 type:complete len:355 (-) Transcript_2089:81-1145(-)
MVLALLALLRERRQFVFVQTVDRARESRRPLDVGERERVALLRVVRGLLLRLEPEALLRELDRDVLAHRVLEHQAHVRRARLVVVLVVDRHKRLDARAPVRIRRGRRAVAELEDLLARDVVRVLLARRELGVVVRAFVRDGVDREVAVVARVPEEHLDVRGRRQRLAVRVVPLLALLGLPLVLRLRRERRLVLEQRRLVGLGVRGTGRGHLRARVRARHFLVAKDAARRAARGPDGPGRRGAVGRDDARGDEARRAAARNDDERDEAADDLQERAAGPAGFLPPEPARRLGRVEHLHRRVPVEDVRRDHRVGRPGRIRLVVVVVLRRGRRDRDAEAAGAPIPHAGHATRMRVGR